MFLCDPNISIFICKGVFKLNHRWIGHTFSTVILSTVRFTCSFVKQIFIPFIFDFIFKAYKVINIIFMTFRGNRATELVVVYTSIVEINCTYAISCAILCTRTATFIFLSCWFSLSFIILHVSASISFNLQVRRA